MRCIRPIAGDLLIASLLLVCGRAAAQDGGKKDAARAACGALTIKGCCQGDRLRYCASGRVRERDCGGQPKCGWNMAKNFYDCGTNGVADPAGKWPQSCPAPVDAAVDLAPRDLALDVASVDGGQEAGVGIDGPIPRRDAQPLEDLSSGDSAGDSKRGRRQTRFTDGAGSCGCRAAEVDGAGLWLLIAIVTLALWRRQRLSSSR